MFSFSQTTQIGHQFFVAGLSALILSASASAQVILRVDGDNGGVPPNSDGSDWGNLAFKFLQDALIEADKQQDPVEIWVAGSETGIVYRPDQSADNQTGTGLRTASFHLLNNVQLYGGFAGGEVSEAQRNPKVNITVLSGDLQGNDNTSEFEEYNFTTFEDNVYHVVTALNVDDSARIDGFVITGGFANGGDMHSSGGAIRAGWDGWPQSSCCYSHDYPGCDDQACQDLVCNHDPFCCGDFNGFWDGDCAAYANQNCDVCTDPVSIHGTPMIRGCVFQYNYSAWNGGAISASFGELVVRNCEFMYNFSGWGGAIGVKTPLEESATPLGDSTLTIINSTFTDNVGSAGGAVSHVIYHGGDMITNIVNCTFAHNIGISGGAVYLFNSNFIEEFASSAITRITNSLFHDNVAEHNASAVYADYWRTTGNCSTTEGVDHFLDIINCTIADNQVKREVFPLDFSDPPGPPVQPDCGGAVQVVASNDANVNIVNTILWGNEIDDELLHCDKLVLCQWQLELTMVSCDILDMQFSVFEGYGSSSCNWYGEFDEIITEDPLFVNREGDDYRLMCHSPAVDRGHPCTTPDPSCPIARDEFDVAEQGGTINDFAPDRALRERIAEGYDSFRVDIGAYEMQSVCLGDLNGDGIVDSGDLGQLLANWGECEDCANCPGDLNCDCTVDGGDLGLLLTLYGDCEQLGHVCECEHASTPESQWQGDPETYEWLMQATLEELVEWLKHWGE